MKSCSLPCLLLALAALVLPLRHAIAADSPELVEARARLLEAFKDGQTDENENVKRLRAKISALEYVAAARASGLDQPPRLVTVDFPGGTAAALIAAIARANGESGFNVVGEKVDLAIELPPFSVRNADPGALAFALNGILQSRGYILSANYRVLPGQSSVFTLRKLFPHEVQQDPRLLPQFQSFQLATYLEQQSIDDIVGAIRAAWELDPSQKADALRIKFHPATGVLLVSGPSQGIVVVQSVLGQLRRSAEKPARDPNVFVPSPPPQKR